MKTQLLLIASSLALCACANSGHLGHISHPSKAALNIIPDHKLDVIAIRENGIESVSTITDEKTLENFKQNHKVTVVCPKFFFAGTEASTDPDARTTSITLLSGEHVLYRDLCFIEKANPDNSVYFSMPIKNTTQNEANAQVK